MSSFVFAESQRAWAGDMATLGRFRSLFHASDGAIVDGEDEERVARIHNVAGALFATAAKYNYWSSRNSKTTQRPWLLPSIV